MTTAYRRTARFFEARPIAAHGFAVAAAAAAVALRAAIAPLLGGAIPFVFLLPAVLIVAVLAGPTAGALTAGLGLLGTWFLILHPAGFADGFTVTDGFVFAALLLCVGVILWITGEMRAAVAESTLSRRRLQAALAASETGTWHWDLPADRLDWDAPLAAVFGLPLSDVPTRGEAFFALVLPEDRDEVRRVVAGALADGDHLEHEFRVRTPDGAVRWIHDRAQVLRGPDGVPLTMVGACHDITRRKAAEEALRGAAAELESRVQQEVKAREEAQASLAQSQRMEAIGQLTGGIAHDFNNLLQALSGCLQMIQRRVPDPAIRGFVDAGHQAVERGARLTQQLMAFARRQALHPEPTDVRNRVLGMSELLARALRADIDVAIDLTPDIWPIEVDPTQFEVALLNLTVNARDAMPDGGELRIGCRNRPGGGTSPDHVEISISDTGTGMAPEVVARVFEPFFTTKEVGKGSGLGLSQVYGFVTQSGGSIRIRSEVGHGTTVTMVLPRSLKVPQEQVPAAAPRVARGGGRILVVEDDAIVAAMVTSVLRDHGYGAVRAASADEAVAMLERGDRVDLVFSDIVMPGRTGGAELARIVHTRWPRLPVILTTGYREKLDVPEDIPIIGKPYQIGTLIDALEAALAPGQDERA